jgi:hypothetical protein
MKVCIFAIWTTTCYGSINMLLHQGVMFVGFSCFCIMDIYSSIKAMNFKAAADKAAVFNDA